MNSFKKIAIIPAAALTACLLLAGCGGAPAATTSAASTPAATTTAAAAPATQQAAPATQAPAASPAAPAASPAAPSTDSYIGDEAAKQAALSHAGVAATDATMVKCELDLDDPTIHYDVEFKAGGMEYDYDIDPVTGAVISFKSEVDD